MKKWNLKMEFLWYYDRNDIKDSNNFYELKNALITEVKIRINFEESFRENCIHMYICIHLQVIA